MKKLAWSEVYRDFKARHPSLSKMSQSFCAYGYAEILVYLKDGSKLTYNYDTRRVRFNPPPLSIMSALTRNAQALL